MSTTITAKQAQRRLAYLWFIGAALPFLLVVLQSLVGSKYGDRSREVWEWLLPTILPTSSLILSVLVVDAHQRSNGRRRIGRLLYNLAFWLAGIYLLIVNAHLVFMPPVDPTGEAVGGLETLSASTIYLGPLQGLVTAAFGAFFVSNAVPDPGDE